MEMAAVGRWFGALTGRGLRSLGFQVDYAPVVDLSAPERQDGIGDRAFAADAEAASLRAGEFLAGLVEAGVDGCLKHFPGLGGAPADTHESLPRMPVDPVAREQGLIPYRRLREQAPMVMVAHAYYPDLSGPTPLPASLDPAVVTGLLRRDVGFAGVIVSDDLEMGAVVDRGPFADIAVAAVAAGNDQILVCHQPDRIHAAWEGLRRAVAGGELAADAVAASLARVEAFKARPACSAATEAYEPEELRLVVDEMRDLSGELDRALRRRT
jgi:beta-N-acetylhexosaminidase